MDLYGSVQKYLSLPFFVGVSAISLFSCNELLTDLCKRDTGSQNCTYEEKGQVLDKIEDAFSAEEYSYVTPDLEARVIITDREGMEIDSLSDQKRVYGFGCTSSGSCQSTSVFTPGGCVTFDLSLHVSPCATSAYVEQDPQLVIQSLQEAYTLAIEEGEKSSQSRVILELFSDIFNY